MGTQQNNLAWLWSRLSAWKWHVGLSLGMAACSVAASLSAPLVLGEIIDIIFAGSIGSQLPAGTPVEQITNHLRAVGNPDLANVIEQSGALPGVGVQVRQLTAWMTILAAVYCVLSLCEWVQGRLLNSVVQRLLFQLRLDVETKLHSLPVAYFDKNSHGDTLSRMTNDIDNIATVIVPLIVRVPTAFFTLVSLLIIMPLLSGWMSLIVLASMPVTVIVGVYVARRAKPHFKEKWDSTGELTAHIEEAYTIQHDLQMLPGGGDQKRFDSINTRQALSSRSAESWSGSISPLLTFVSTAVFLGILLLGAFRVAAGVMSLGEVQAFVQFSQQISQPVNELSSITTVIQSGLASLRRVRELLAESDQEECHRKSLTARNVAAVGPPTITFDNVTFAYDDRPPALNGVSLVVPAGGTVAVVGESGAGKTTLINLLLRFYTPSKGRILFDSDDINELPLAGVRADVGLVTQDRWLFRGSIRDNVSYGARTEVSDDVVVAALRASHAYHFVESLPQGIHTLVGDGALELSEGQAQLLTIARAMVGQPRVLLLDEATSAVDSRTELQVQQALEVLRQRCTTVVIAHRLSTIREADYIAVLHRGKLVEIGNHDELIVNASRYAELYAAQYS